MFKVQLLAWLTAPFVRAWQDGARRTEAASLHFGTPSDLFVAYIHLVTMAAALIALPFLARQAWAWLHPRSFAAAGISVRAFFLLSYLTSALGLLLAWRVLLPPMLDRMLESTGTGSAVLGRDYVGFALRPIAVSCLITQLILVGFVVNRAKR